MHYLYDGSLTGLFCVFQTILESRIQPHTICQTEQFTPSLFAEIRTIPTDEATAAKILERVNRLGGQQMFRNLALVFLSETPDFEMKMYHYLCLAISSKKDPCGQMQHPAVAACHSIWQKVQREVHRFQGFLRFEELENGLLWASFAPDANISALLAPYFSRHMPDETFMICDVKRGIGIFYENGETGEVEIDAKILKQLRAHATLRNSPDEYAQLWQRYFDKIAITSRKNPKLHKSLMPKKYWTYLTEKMG